MLVAAGSFVLPCIAATDLFLWILAVLKPLLQRDDDGRSEMVEMDGNTLIRNHIREFETDNLILMETDISGASLPKARVVRCMNVLIYYPPQARHAMVRGMMAHLMDGGILIAGTNGNDLQSRYAVYRNSSGGSVAVEFSFSLDNLRPFGVMPWLTIHAGDPEAALLARLTGALRCDREFWSSFDRRVDTLLHRHGVCRRGDNGFLEFIAPQLPMAELMKRMALLWRQIAAEGFPDAMVDVLRRCGWEARVNPVGHITVRSPSGALPMP